MRVVLDTNVLISAFLFGGKLKFIIDLLKHGTITPCFSYTTWDELQRVLQYPHLLPVLQKQDIDSEDLLARIELQSLLFSNSHSPISIPEDKNDEAFLACALVASAKAIITGDKHLLTLASIFPIPILTPQRFKRGLE